MPTYIVTYELETTRSVIVRERAERLVTAATFAEAVEFAQREQDLEPFVVEVLSSVESSSTAPQLLSVTEAPAAPAAIDPGLPPAYYSSEPSPAGDDYNFIQVEPTPFSG